MTATKKPKIIFVDPKEAWGRRFLSEETLQKVAETNPGIAKALREQQELAIHQGTEGKTMH